MAGPMHFFREWQATWKERHDLTDCVKLQFIWDDEADHNRRWAIICSGAFAMFAVAVGAMVMVSQSGRLWLNILIGTSIVTALLFCAAFRYGWRALCWHRAGADRKLVEFKATDWPLELDVEELRLHLPTVVGKPGKRIGRILYIPTKRSRTTVRFPKAHLRRMKKHWWSRPTWMLHPGHEVEFKMANGYTDADVVRLRERLFGSGAHPQSPSQPEFPVLVPKS